MPKKPVDEDDFTITDDDVQGLSNGAHTTIPADPGVGDEPIIEVAEDGADVDADPSFEASEALKEQIATLKQQNKDEATARTAAEAKLADERRAREADAAKFAKTETDLNDTRLDTINSALATNELALKDAKSRYTAALQEGDFAKAADVQSEMSDLSVKKQRLDEGRNAIEVQIEQAKESPPVQPRQPTIDDWMERLPTEQRAWAKDHREWFTSPGKNAKVMAAHFEAVEENGLREGSPQYFDFIETQLGLKGPPEVTRTERREANPPAAPVSRGSPSMTTGARQNNGNRFRLTAREAEAAQMSGISLKEYFENMSPEQQAAARARVN